MYIVCDADCIHQVNRHCPTFCVTASYIWIKKGGICSFYTKRVAAQPDIEADADKVPKCCADMKPDPLDGEPGGG